MACFCFCFCLAMGREGDREEEGGEEEKEKEPTYLPSYLLTTQEQASKESTPCPE